MALKYSHTSPFLPSFHLKISYYFSIKHIHRIMSLKFLMSLKLLGKSPNEIEVAVLELLRHNTITAAPTEVDNYSVAEPLQPPFQSTQTSEDKAVPQFGSAVTSISRRQSSPGGELSKSIHDEIGASRLFIMHVYINNSFLLQK